MRTTRLDETKGLSGRVLPPAAASGRRVGKSRGTKFVLRDPSAWLYLSSRQLAACLSLPSVEVAVNQDVW